MKILAEIDAIRCVIIGFDAARLPKLKPCSLNVQLPVSHWLSAGSGRDMPSSIYVLFGRCIKASFVLRSRGRQPVTHGPGSQRGLPPALSTAGDSYASIGTAGEGDDVKNH
jgi:hypothetical protein